MKCDSIFVMSLHLMAMEHDLGPCSLVWAKVDPRRALIGHERATNQSECEPIFRYPITIGRFVERKATRTGWPKENEPEDTHQKEQNEKEEEEEENGGKRRGFPRDPSWWRGAIAVDDASP